MESVNASDLRYTDVDCLAPVRVTRPRLVRSCCHERRQPACRCAAWSAGAKDSRGRSDRAAAPRTNHGRSHENLCHHAESCSTSRQHQEAWLSGFCQADSFLQSGEVLPPCAFLGMLAALPKRFTASGLWRLGHNLHMLCGLL